VHSQRRDLAAEVLADLGLVAPEPGRAAASLARAAAWAGVPMGSLRRH
jgi:hypothetical protein